jgi:hypothetical protein
MQMRFFILLALSVATTALPFGEETLVEVHAEAQAEVNSLLASGTDEKACKQLAKSIIDVVEKDVREQDKLLKALSNGSDCAKEGQEAVKKAEAVLKKAKAKVKTAEGAEKKALDTPLKYTTTVGSVKGDTCVVGKKGSQYTKAKNKYHEAVKATEKAKGARKQATTSLKSAKDEAKKAEHACLCKARRAHKEAWKTATKSNAANQKVYAKGKHMLCVLKGTSLSKCPTANAPKPKQVKMSKAVQNAKCGPFELKQVADKCGGARGYTCTGAQIILLAASLKKSVLLSSKQAKTQYKCPSNYFWPTGDFLHAYMKNNCPNLTSQLKKKDENAYTGPDCGWSTYTFKGVKRQLFSFSDSAKTDVYQHAGNALGSGTNGAPFPGYDPSTTTWAGIVCMSNGAKR